MAGGIQVLRIQTHNRLDGGLVNHVLGKKRPDTAYPVFPPAELVQDRAEEARLLLAHFRALRKAKRGRPPKEVLSVVLAGPYPYGHPKAFDYLREVQWAKDSIAWLQRLIGPKSLVVAVALHRDETSPHVHALIVPVTTDGRLTWCGVRDEAVARMGRKHRRGKPRYSHFQDDYQAEVAITYDLGRGNVGSLAKHEGINRARAIDSRNARLAAQEKDLRSNVTRLRDQAESERQAVEAEKKRQADLAADEKKRKDELAAEEGRVAKVLDDAALAVQPSVLSRVPGVRALLPGPSTAAERGQQIRAGWETERSRIDDENESLKETVETLRGEKRVLEARVNTEVTERDEHKATAARRLVTLEKAGKQKVQLQEKISTLESTVTELSTQLESAKAVGWQEFAQRLVKVALRFLPSAAHDFFRYPVITKLINGVMGSPPVLLEEAQLGKEVGSDQTTGHQPTARSLRQGT